MLDKKDYRILAELAINSRISFTQLAKKVGVSREVATYRVSRLINKNIILDFYTIINTEKLGFQRHTCFLELKGISKKKEMTLINNLVEHPFITYLGTMVGNWNLALDILARNNQHLDQLIKGIKTKIKPHLHNFLVVESAVVQELFPTKLLDVIKKPKKRTPQIQRHIDTLDLQILALLSQNSRIDYKELGKHIPLSANAIKYRIRQLERSGIIQTYTTSINMQALGYEWYNIQLHTNKQLSQLKTFLRQHKNIIYFYAYSNNEPWNMDIGIMVKNSEEIRTFLLELREHFSQETRIHNIFLILDLLKGNHTPKGIFEQYAEKR